MSYFRDLPKRIVTTGLAIVLNAEQSRNSVIDAESAGGIYNVTIPTTVGNNGAEIIVKRRGANVVTVVPAAGTIDDAANFPLNNDNDACHVVADTANTDWMIV